MSNIYINNNISQDKKDMEKEIPQINIENLLINKESKEINLNNKEEKIYNGKIEQYDSSFQSEKNDDKNQVICNSLELDKIQIDLTNPKKGISSYKNNINENNEFLENNRLYDKNNNINKNNNIQIRNSYKEIENKNIPSKNIKIKENNIKNSDEDISSKKEDFLKNQELKLKKDINNIENDEDGKENVEEDEEEEENDIQKNIESSINFEEKNKKYKEQNININNDSFIKNNYSDTIQIKKMPIKLLKDYLDGTSNYENENKNELKINNDINNRVNYDIKYNSENNSKINNYSSIIKEMKKNDDSKRKDLEFLSENDKIYTKNYINKINNNKLKQNLYLMKYQKNPKNKNESLTPEKSGYITRNKPQLLNNNSSNINYHINDSVCEYNNINEILMDLSENNSKSYSNIIKQKKNCYNIFIEKTNIKLDNIINKYSFREKLSIINIIQCLFDLKIINDLIKKNQINDLDKENIKYIILNINENEKKKLEELQFIEQLWFKMNPLGDDYIKSTLFLKLLKILFSCNNYSINDFKISNLSKNIEKILIKNNININNIGKNIEFISPLRDIKYEINDIWSISRLIKKFYKLKSNINIYKNIDYKYKKNTNKEEQIKIKNSKSSDKIFITPKKINKNEDYGDSSFSKIQKKNEIPVYERLYSMRKIYNNGSKSIRDSKLENYDFKPIFFSNEKLMNKSFTNYNKEKKPKGYYDYILRNRLLINQKENDKKIIDDKIYGKNYEKIKKMKIEPFNITDLKEDNINKRNNKIKEKHIYINNNIIDKIYITLDIKIPNGELKQLKIYKNDNNLIDLVDDFCEKYEMYEDDRDLLVSRVMQYKNEFFEKIIMEENNEINIKEEI